MPAGLSGAGWLAIAHEATMGTYVETTDPGTVWVPILSEDLKYTEQKYYSEQIRQEAIESEVARSYYHVEGSVRMEADPQFLPLFLHCSRHKIERTPDGDAFEYVYTPEKFGSAFSGDIEDGDPQTASITIVRNEQGFGYAGCVVGSMEFTIDNGVLVVTFNVIGLSEQEPSDLDDTPVWVQSVILGADSHDIYVADAATSEDPDPTFTDPIVDFNGITININYNGEAQNRIQSTRAAAYISYGKTEVSYTTELDFIDRDEYDNFVNADTRALRLESKRLDDGMTTFDDVDYGVRIDINRTNYETYDVNLAGMADLLMANVTGRALGVAGADAFTITVRSTTDVPVGGTGGTGGSG